MRNVRMLAWLFALLLAAWLPGVASAQQVLQLQPGLDDIQLSPYLAYRHDSGGVDDADDAFRRLAAGEFAPLPGQSEFGFQPGAYWFHARVVNRDPAETRWILVQQYALSDYIDLYVRYADGRVVHQAGGDHRPFDARSISDRHPNFQFALPAGQPVELLVRVQSESSMQVPLALLTPTAFAGLARDAQLAIGVYYGILLALFFYNAVLWLMLRDGSYFWYLFHLSAFGMVLFTLNGLGFEYLWPNSAWMTDKSVPLSICLALIGMQQFARTFLELKKRFPRGNQVSIALIGFFVLLGIASLWLPYRVATPIAARAVLVGVLWIAVAGVVVVRRGYVPARLFMLAWSMFLLGTTLFTLIAFGAMPKTFYTEYGVQIGSAAEMLLLSIALGNRYAALRRENARITEEANQKLERKVAQRTQEVRSALVQLEEAHGRLRDSSRRDGLTGLYNRTYFHEAFEKMLAEGRRSHRAVSLLMIDLDHFKKINDAYGHLVGDDCLRCTSNTMAEALAPHGALLARFGGEEFIAALPGMDLAQASAVAEELRQSLNRRPCVSGDLVIPVSASIGVHSVDVAAKNSIESALQVADQALYAAKAEGRDCVRTL